MKKTSIITMFVVLTSISLFAQSNKEEVEYIQSIFGMEKKAIVAKFIELEEPAKGNFWTLYDQYEAERKKLGQKRITLLTEYAESYYELTDEKIDDLMNDMIRQKGSTDQLLTRYYRKIKSKAGSQAAAQFFQIETYLLSAIRMTILENIPFIGELEG